jgi:hypothetical protein
VSADAPPPFKVTPAYYAFSDRSSAADLNLRHTSELLGNVWLGYFHWPSEDVHQWRTGWDREFGETVRVKPSAQAASGGFVGGSVQAEVGRPWFIAVGIGRTNLRPYYNLNFDPNDSYTIQAGWRDEEAGRTGSVLLVRDNREHPDQRHVHLNWRQSLPGGRRVTLDLLDKAGTLDDGTRIHRQGFTLSYDWPRVFVLVAYDPKTNFSPLDLWRVAVGMRF